MSDKAYDSCCVQAFKKLDLEDFERNFSAYQRQDDVDGARSPAKARELTIIDGRRAQNCTIMLSKLKMTNEELKRAIMSVDSQDDIPKDMCEQVSLSSFSSLKGRH